MTNVEMYREGNRYEIRILGHAGYGTIGNDIVCAAVSVLSATLVQSLNDMEEDGELKSYEKETAPGCVIIKAEPQKSSEEKINIILETIMTGYFLIQKKYEKYVHVEGEIRNRDVV